MRTDREIAALLFRACHDLRTPNRSIRAYAELLQKDGAACPPADLEQRLAFIVDGARKIDRLIEALAGYALALDIDSSSFQPIRLDVVVRSALAKMEEPLRESSAEVDYADLPRIQGSPDRLTQLFTELIGNSLAHRGDALPRIRISSPPHGDACLLSVSDNGPGVEAADLERIFQPFERLHGQGSGLGLAACRAIVECHGGKIWAEAATPYGLDVRFTLPQA
jgi:light-regulated signal transduction histidine kinase (bacteriophytochrome)